MPDLGEFVPELVCLGIDLAICGVLASALHSTNSVLAQLAAAPEIPVDADMAARLENHPGAVRSGPDLAITSLPYAVVRGEVEPLGKTVTSAYSPSVVQGVIQKVIFTEHKRNMSRTGFWVDSQKVIHSYTNEAPFCLSQPNASFLSSLSKPRVEVLDWTDAARVDLDTVYDHFEGAGGGLGSHLWGWVVGDMQKGVQQTEQMLVKGSTITGIGELVSTPMGMRLQPPADGRPFYLVRNSLSSLVKEVEGSRMAIKVFLGIFGSLGLAVAGLGAWKLYKKRLAEAESRVNQARLESIVAERPARRPRPEGEVPEGLQCVVCLGAEREVIMLDCGHVCSCADCAAELLRVGQPCPVCRAVIVRVMPAYVS